MGKLPILLCIDVEPDTRKVAMDGESAWPGFEATFELLQNLHPRFREATGQSVHYSWFLRMDPQVERAYGSARWVADRYGPMLRQLESEGDEIGLHTHAWRWDERRGHWYHDFVDQNWIERCVRMSFDAYWTAFRRPCRSFRFGDGWLNNATVSLLDSLGVEYDLTIEPGRLVDFPQEASTGKMPDYRDAPRHPFRPSRSNFTQIGDWQKRSICMLPLTTVDIGAAVYAVMSAAVPLVESTNGLDGYLDVGNRREIAGWAFDRSRPNESVAIELLVNDRVLATVSADEFRRDLRDAGLGNGRHGFWLATPQSLRTVSELTTRARVAGTNWELRDSPRTVSAMIDPNSACFETLDLCRHFRRIGPQIDHVLRIEQSPYLALVVRSSAGAADDREMAIEATLDYLSTHIEGGRFAFSTPESTVRLLKE